MRAANVARQGGLGAAGLHNDDDTSWRRQGRNAEPFPRYVAEVETWRQKRLGAAERLDRPAHGGKIGHLSVDLDVGTDRDGQDEHSDGQYEHSDGQYEHSDVGMRESDERGLRLKAGAEVVRCQVEAAESSSLSPSPSLLLSP